MFITIKNQKSKNKKLQNQVNNYNNSYIELNNRFEKLMEENKIEKKHNKELVEKLANISCMSINDVLSQLQND